MYNLEDNKHLLPAFSHYGKKLNEESNAIFIFHLLAWEATAKPNWVYSQFLTTYTRLRVC